MVPTNTPFQLQGTALPDIPINHQTIGSFTGMQLSLLREKDTCRLC
jgi:hypothetical protein